MRPHFEHTDESFSQVLLGVSEKITHEGLTLAGLLERLGARGLLMFCMVLTFPFLLPVSIPGTSAPFGLLVALIGLGILVNRPPWLPDKLMQRRISGEKLVPLLAKGAALFSRIEKIIHPRLLALTHGALMVRWNGVMLTLSGILLIAPIPVIFSNTLPAYAVLFLAAGSLERDGFAILTGYAMLLATIAYFTFLALVGFAGFKWLANMD